MDKNLAELIKISRAVGRDSSLVQGGGGNASVKAGDGKYMYIKASGTALKDMSAKKGWRRLKLDAVLAVIRDKTLARFDVARREAEVVRRLQRACADKVKGSARPSVESHLHGLLGRCVIHVHAVAVGAYVSARNGRAEFETLFKGQKLPPLWVGYADPGFQLAKKVARQIGKYKRCYGKEPAIMALEKHGLFVVADDAEAVLRLLRRVIKLCRSRLKETKAVRIKHADPTQIATAKLTLRQAILDVTTRYVTISHFRNGKIAGFCARKDAEMLLRAGVLMPDELTYANGAPLWVDHCDTKHIVRKLRTQVAKGRKMPTAFLVKGLGLFVAGPPKLASIIADITSYSLLVRSCAVQLGGLRCLNKRQEDFINNWEAESFRIRLAGGQEK